MTPELLLQVQNKQIEIMDVIHDVCKKNDIEYYIIGGTALGAVRHGGFIPWDIDIDIAMSRVNYERFLSLSEEILPEELVCYSHKNEADYFPPHALVALKNSKLIQKDDYLNPKLKRYGIYVDIFPLDVAPDDEEKRRKQAKRISAIRNAKTRKKAITYSQNSTLVKTVKKIVSLMYSFVSMESLNQKLDASMKQYSEQSDSNACWCSMASHYSYKKQCMPKEIYGKPTLINFAGRQYYAPEILDEYLKRIFNDYMKLPSKEQQQYQMDYFVDAEW